ncbi:uncharacterized protein Z518_00756 [Rhinocladiella mackenziei CBS 650.93]|uniref:Uncharacterized protein n=1 Tax=Rhinocladiella mackenziei CBS 650.93 TaxID=1442369 RepID=A0A0D2JJP5_9EURO|nr:uncharacterized protein Z518_00756 [Rhinocladiella mackenziei CBS 650.93]KIX09675.1 hypothetical protein Z518_00756 [Rhinocladiella mackenziei CBS 650.93]
MSGPDDIDLPSLYGSSSYGLGEQPHSRRSLRTFGHLHRKSASAAYNPILTPQEEYGNRALPARDKQAPPSTTLGPGRIGKFGADLVLEIIVCAFAVLVAVPFLWLAITMAKFDHDEVTDSKTDFIKQATSTASTLFTILFAAVLGSSLKRFATWRLERGIRLGLLEQIMQSRTVFQAVTTQLSFRAFNLTALILLISWTFSPLGSQASLRLISTGTELTTDTGLVSYVDTITNQVFDSVSGVDSLLTALKPTYVSSVLGPNSTKSGTMDLWGAVRIPWLVENAEKDADGWTNLSKSNLTEGSYTSLVGVPVASLANRNASFVIETTYMNLDCDKPQNESLVDINFNVTSGNGTFLGPNTTSPDDSAIYPSWQVAMNQFVSNSLYFYGYPELLVNVSDADIPQATFLFQTRGPWVARCQINQIYVESNVTCEAVTDSQIPVCSVSAQRKSPKRHAPSTVTTLSFPSTFDYMTSEWILATDPLLSSGYSSLSEYYLQNTTAAFILSGNDREYADYGNVTAQQFSQRLGQLLNTWVLAGQVSANAMEYSLSHRNSTATYTVAHAVYLCSWTWLGVYCASIAVMLTAGAFSIWCAFHTTVPDVLSYCSSLTRDSKFFEFAKGGSTLDGLHRAKTLRNVQVKFGEVVDPSDDGFRNDFVNEIGSRPNDGMGCLAIAPPEYVRAPKRGLLYA